MTQYLVNYVDQIGRRFLSIFVYTYKVISLLHVATRSAVFDQSQGLRQIIRVTLAQIYFTGWQALPLISVLAVATGGIVIMQASFQLSIFGGSDIAGRLMMAVIVREVAPLMTALVVIARSGTAVASELGNMQVNKEIMAMESMGINPLSYIVFPRLLGGVISVVSLAFYFSLIAIVGGYTVTMLIHNISFSHYLNSIVESFQEKDILMFFLKNIFSGTIIFVVSCYQGMQVEQSPHEVPQATTRAVMNSIIYVIFFNLFLTILFYLSELRKMDVL